MTLSAGLVLTSTLLCAPVTDFVFTDAVVVMPGEARRQGIHQGVSGYR